MRPGPRAAPLALALAAPLALALAALASRRVRGRVPRRGIGLQRMESGRSRLGNDGLAIDRLLLFTRCSFLVEIRLTLPTAPGRTSTDRADRVVRHYAERLDRRLSVVFCPES